MFTLARAIELAAHYHADQLRKDGEPYILHPLRVMFQMRNDPEKHKAMIAVLHDVFEDTPYTFFELHKEGCPEEVMQPLCALTRPKNADYDDYISRVAKFPLAVEVKIEDLKDNLNFSAWDRALTEKDHQRITRYTHALTFLMSVAGGQK